MKQFNYANNASRDTTKLMLGVFNKVVLNSNTEMIAAFNVIPHVYHVKDLIQIIVYLVLQVINFNSIRLVLK